VNRFLYCLLVFAIISLFTAPASAVRELKLSRLHGGEQYWWEAEDFDDRDETVLLLKDEEGSSVPALPGAFGDQYIVHNSADKTVAVEGSHFLEYNINVRRGGQYYVWARASWDRTPDGRTHNSMYVQVNGQPPIGTFDKHVNTLSDANWPVDTPVDNPWVWAGDSAQPQELQGVAGGGLTNGLVMNLNAGQNSFMIYHREGGVASNTLCNDVIMISTVDFVPTDDDYKGASLAVESTGKLAATWAQLKVR